MAEDDKPSSDIGGHLRVDEKGVDFGIRSRAAAMLDALGASKLAKRVARNEGEAAVEAQRARLKNELFQAGAERAIALARSDPAIADHVAEGLLAEALPHLGRSPRQQSNVDEVITLALEDLSTNGESEAAADDKQEVSPEFLDRFGRYAEDASTEELRDRWAKVLASEVRKPGTFSRKVMRIVDEIDKETAELFQQFAALRIGDCVPRIFAPKVKLKQEHSLFHADLLLDASSGTAKMLSPPLNASDRPTVGVRLGDFTFVFSNTATILQTTDERVALESELFAVADRNVPTSIPAYILTDQGHALASIVPTDQRKNALRLANAMSQQIGSLPVEVVELVGTQHFKTSVSFTPSPRAVGEDEALSS